MKQAIKYSLKNNPIFFNIIARVIFLYLKFTYFTSKWHFIMPPGLNEQEIDKEDGLFFAIWHNKLVYSIYILGGYKNIFALISPHSDGKLISKIVRMFRHKIIEGSTNKNSNAAVKEIIKKVTHGGKIVVTPDGPRGPVYKNGSTITRIASKYHKKVFPVSCYPSKYFQLNSWDKMLIPKPFSKITVIIGEPLILSGDAEKDRLLLEERLGGM